MTHDLSLVCSYCCCVHAFVAGAESCKTRTTRATKAGHKAVSSNKKVVLSSPDPARMMMLLYVEASIIAHLLAFSLSDSKDVRVFFDVCSEAAFPKDDKHYVIELYRATMSQFSHNLRQPVTGVGGPILHVYDG